MSDILLLLSLTLFGLVFGSFVSALSYRTVRGISIFIGRSFCDSCKKKINWKDNIPVFSFYFLKGRSSCCKKLISIRYPLIEFATALVFVITGARFLTENTVNTPIYDLKQMLGVFSLPVLLFVGVFLLAAFVTDLEYKIIPDTFVFVPYSIVLLLLVIFNPDYTYTNVFASFASASFFLLIHLFTKGKGMGLGDVKLALLPPLILGWPYTLIWLFFSFIIGAVVGVFLIAIGKAKFGKHIPFGPFLIFAYFLVLLWGEKFSFLFNFV